jgi:hypothetical protein
LILFKCTQLTTKTRFYFILMLHLLIIIATSNLDYWEIWQLSMQNCDHTPERAPRKQIWEEFERQNG